MSRLRPASRRALAVAASAFIGLVGAVAIASPAQAHHTYVNGSAECPDPQTGEWVVTWTITSWLPSGDTPENYQIKELNAGPAGTEVTGITLYENKSVTEAFVGEQVVPGDQDTATLSVKAKWDNRVKRTNRGEVTRPAPCEVPEDPAPLETGATATCDGLDVTVVNPEDGETAEVTLTPTSGDPVAETLEPGESAEHSFEAGEDGLTVTVTAGAEELAVFEWEEPADCDEPENGEGGGDEELPVTGLQGSVAIGSALLLLALGAGLFLVARRRRITFTA